MKALTVSHLYPNTSEPYKGVFVAELTSALRQYVDIRVAAPLSWFPVLRPRREIPNHCDVAGTRIYHPRYPAMPKPLRNVRWIPYQAALDRTLRTVAAEDFIPEILHAHWVYPDGYAAAKLAKRIGAKSVVTVHGHASLGLGIQGLTTSKCRESLQLVDLIITVSEELREILITQFGVSPERIRVIHNGIDPGKFEYRDRETARRTLGLALNRPVILCVARLSAEKQIHLLIEAISRLPETPLQVFIVGDGPLRSDLHSLIAALGLQNRVILTGGIPHQSLADWYYASDLFCLTSAHEGCPVVVHEALACGVPVISTPVGAVPDLIDPGENGLLTGPDPDSIAAALKNALSRTWNRTKIGTEGQIHTWQDVAEKTVFEFERLLHS